MDYSEIHNCAGDTVLSGVRRFNLADILECGQCFRWERIGQSAYRGTVEGVTRTVSQQGDRLVFHGVPEQEFNTLWHEYFDLDRDYGELQVLLACDPVMRRAVEFTPGMRVLRQKPWETLCSFILSANNNIARIRGIVGRLCQLLGQPVGDGYAFPTPARLAAASANSLAPARCGYRADYLLDAARRVADGSLDLELPRTLPPDEARAYLRQVKGVGPKVADCVLLYGYARAECVPVDVWIRRALDNLYPNGMPEAILPVAGLGQQYLFHYVRNCPDALIAG